MLLQELSAVDALLYECHLTLGLSALSMCFIAEGLFLFLFSVFIFCV